MIETARLVLRKPRLDDVPVLGFLRDPEVMGFIGGVEAIPAEQIVERWLDRWQENGFGYLVVVRRDDGAVVGRSGLVLWDTRPPWHASTRPDAGEHGQPELGWALAREHWRCGYATEAAAAVRDWAYREIAVERLVSLTHPANVRSIGVIDRLGGEPEELVSTVHGPAIVWTHPR